MKVAIIGYGFVGKAIENGLSNKVQLYKVDPLLNTNIKDLKDFKPNIIFVCVPTPMLGDYDQDTSILEKVLCEIKDLGIKTSIVVKSTVLPNNLGNLSLGFKDLVYNPEFLREKNANKDFIESKLIIFGGKEEYARSISEFYLKYTKCKTKKHIFTDLISASLIKYTINSFLALKVIFFNELFDVFEESDAEDSWENFISYISRDARIGKSHMQVPGHDGRKGFGGACLPKDTAAISSYSNDLRKPLTVLDAAIEKNKKIRSKYKKRTKREVDQNIKFND